MKTAPSNSVYSGRDIGGIAADGRLPNIALRTTKPMHSFLGAGMMCIAFTAWAQPSADQVTVEVTDNVAMEYAECSAYFAIAQGALQNSGNIAAAEKYKAASDQAAHFSLLAAQQSRSEAMATKVTLARFELSLRDMQRTIQNNYSNMSLLSNKYSDSCIAAMTDSAAVMRRWAEKISSKYGTSTK